MRRIDLLIEQATALIRQSSYIVALTGAGISTPSGIPDFRSADSGLWEQVDPMAVASIYAFRQQPQAFYDWIYPLARQILEAQPNAAHLALAQMEARGPLKGIITQNIDLLHAKAGSRAIYEVHGHMREATCLECRQVYGGENILQEFLDTGDVPYCQECGGVLKPNVVLFGELLPVNVLNQAKEHSQRCDLMIAAGSSLEVMPAGDLPLMAKQSGAQLIFVNFSETHLDYLADVVIHADVVDVLPRLAAVL